MPDLRPDTSFYPKPQQQSPGSIIDLLNSMQEMQRKQALSRSVSKNIDQNGVLNVPAATHDYMTGPGYKDPADLSSINRAADDVSGTRLKWTQQASEALASSINDPRMTPEKFSKTIGPMLARAGIPGDIINEISSANNQQEFRDRIAQAQQYTYKLGGIPTVGEVTGIGGKEEIPAGRKVFPPAPSGAAPDARRPPGASQLDANGNGIVSPTPRAKGGSGQAFVPGAYTTELPEGARQSMKTATDAQAALQAQLRELPSQRAALRTLDVLSPSAGSSPSADFETKFNEYAQRIGFKGPWSKEQLANTEEYGKIVATMTGQMGANLGTGGAAWLENAMHANPNLHLSDLGRTGIHHWLLGNVNSIDRIGTQWNEWLGKHPGQEGQFNNWQHGNVPDANFNIKDFDPRVFQFEAMTGSERKRFWEMMPKRQKDEFTTHLKDYQAKNWVPGLPSPPPSVTVPRRTDTNAAQ